MPPSRSLAASEDETGRRADLFFPRYEIFFEGGGSKK
jgi:hypothetical protein